MLAIGRLRVRESARIDHRAVSELLELRFVLLPLCQQFLQPRDLRLRQVRRAISRFELFVRSVFAPVRRRGDHLPRVRAGRHFDPVVCRQPVLELLFAIAAPHDLVDGDRFGKLQFHPALARLAGNPTAAVARLPVVDVIEPVNLRIRIRAGRGGFCRGTRQRHVARRLIALRHRINFQLVNARFRPGRLGDRETQPLRRDRREPLDVQARMHRRTRRRLPRHAAQRFRVLARFNLVTRREPVLELFLAVASPDDPVNPDRRGKFQLHPAPTRLTGSPTATVAELAVVDVFSFVNIRIRIRAGYRHLRSHTRQRDVG